MTTDKSQTGMVTIRTMGQLREFMRVFNCVTDETPVFFKRDFVSKEYLGALSEKPNKEPDFGGGVGMYDSTGIAIQLLQTDDTNF